MNSTLKNILDELGQVSAALDQYSNNEPYSITSNNWSFPGLTKTELIDKINEIAELIRARGPENLGTQEKLVQDYIRRLAFIRNNTVPNLPGNAGLGVPTLILTLDGLSKALAPVLRTDGDIANELSQTSKRILTRLRALETRLGDTEPRATRLAEMVKRIELAYDAADQLPIDLQQLTEDREKVAALLKSAQEDRALIQQDQVDAALLMSQLSSKNEEASAVLAHCNSAYAAATSQGLAAAFAERSQDLSRTMWIWTLSFIAALGVGAYFGTQRVHEIEALLKNPAMTNWALGINLFLAAMSVGAPIWFGWLATKQINQRFRLSEDYAFKAAVSRAYEGYRKEAARIDKDMEAKLLSSALTRLDEQPLRFVETANHGTPWHELASSDAVKTALNTVPGFAEKIVEFARSTIRAKTNDKPSDSD